MRTRRSRERRASTRYAGEEWVGDVEMFDADVDRMEVDRCVADENSDPNVAPPVVTPEGHVDKRRRQSAASKRTRTHALSDAHWQAARHRAVGPAGRERERERELPRFAESYPHHKMLEREKETLLFQTLLRITLVCNAVSLSLSLPRTRRRRGGRERGNEAVNGSARHSPCGSSSLFPHFSPARICLIANNVLIRRRTRRRAGSCVTHTHRFEVFIPGTPSRPGRTLGPSPGRSGRQPSGDPHVDAPPSEGRRRVGVRRARELGRIDRVAGVLRVQIIRGGTCSGAFLSCVHPRNNYM